MSRSPLAFVASRLALCGALAASALAAAAPRAAIVVQLPGASGAEVARRFAAGELAEGGFRPFFERGEVGPELVPVDPALPATSAWVLATGRRPGELGMALVAPEEVVLPAADAEAAMAAPRAGAATLWTRAFAEGRTVGAVFWPGLDETASAERGSWGVPDRATVHYPERFLVLAADDWFDARYGVGPGPARRWGLPPTVESFSPPRRTSIPFALPHERPDRGLIYELVAVDRTDDGVVNYDGVLLSSKINPREGYAGIAEPGSWFRLELATVSGVPTKTPHIAWVKVMELAPDLSKARIFVSSTAATRPFPATLVRQLEQDRIGWPGAPSRASLENGLATGFGVDLPTFAESAERLAAYAVDVALAGRRLFSTDLTLVSIPVLDEVDRALALVDPRQPSWSAEAAAARTAARDEVFHALDRQLARLLADVDLETTAVFLVSGYANAPVHTEVDLGQAVRAALPAGADLTGWSFLAAGAFGEIRAPRGAQSGPALAAARASLVGLADAGAPVIARVLTRAEAKKLGYDPARGADLLVWTRPGYRLSSATKDVALFARRGGPLAASGWLAEEPSGHGLWLAMGAGVEKKSLREPPVALGIARRIARAAGFRLR